MKRNIETSNQGKRKLYHSQKDIQNRTKTEFLNTSFSLQTKKLQARTLLRNKYCQLAEQSIKKDYALSNLKPFSSFTDANQIFNQVRSIPQQGKISFKGLQKRNSSFINKHAKTYYGIGMTGVSLKETKKCSLNKNNAEKNNVQVFKPLNEKASRIITAISEKLFKKKEIKKRSLSSFQSMPNKYIKSEIFDAQQQFFENYLSDTENQRQNRQKSLQKIAKRIKQLSEETQLHKNIKLDQFQQVKKEKRLIQQKQGKICEQYSYIQPGDISLKPVRRQRRNKFNSNGLQNIDKTDIGLFVAAKNRIYKESIDTKQKQQNQLTKNRNLNMAAQSRNFYRKFLANYTQRRRILSQGHLN